MFGLISSTVVSRCSNDVVWTVSVLLSFAGFNLISVTGKFFSPRGEVEAHIYKVEKINAHRIATFTWRKAGALSERKRYWADGEVGDTTAGPMAGLGYNDQFVKIVLVGIHHRSYIRKPWA